MEGVGCRAEQALGIENILGEEEELRKSHRLTEDVRPSWAF